MATLYSIKFTGQMGEGFGVMYVGNGTIAGFDIDGGHYRGTHSEQGERFRATISFSVPDGGQIVTGQWVSPGTSIPLFVDWPANFANGRAQEIIVQGQRVNVELEKLKDI